MGWEGRPGEGGWGAEDDGVHRFTKPPTSTQPVSAGQTGSLSEPTPPNHAIPNLTGQRVPAPGSSPAAAHWATPASGFMVLHQPPGCHPASQGAAHSATILAP